MRGLVTMTRVVVCGDSCTIAAHNQGGSVMAQLKLHRAHVVVVVVASLCIGGMGVAGLRAQGNNPFDALAATLNALASSVDAVSADLGEIESSVDAISVDLGALVEPGPGPVQLSTGLVRAAQGDVVACQLANVSNRSIDPIAIRLRDTAGTEVINMPAAAADPGTGGGFSNILAASGFYRCDFTFTGFVNEVRGTLNLFGIGEDSARLVADAR